MNRQLYYGNFTRDEWEQGRRYAESLARRFVLRLPRWADRDGLISAGYEGLIAASQNWRPERGDLTPYLRQAVKSRLLREWNSQCNWHRQRRANAKFAPGEREVLPFSLDMLVRDGDERIADLLPAADDPANEVCLRLTLEAALARLAADERESFLRSLAGESHLAQARREGGVTKAQIYRRASRARAALRQALEGVL